MSEIVITTDTSTITIESDEPLDTVDLATIIAEHDGKTGTHATDFELITVAEKVEEVPVEAPVEDVNAPDED